MDASVAARWPVPHYRAAFSRDPLAHELRLVPTSLKLASEYKRATHRNLRHSDRWFNVQFGFKDVDVVERLVTCLLYTSPSPRDKRQSRMPSSA